MADRLTPLRPYVVPFDLIPGGSDPVELFVDDGTHLVHVNGEARHTVTRSGSVTLTPLASSDAPNLRLVACQNAEKIGASNAFAVAAIPTAVQLGASRSLSAPDSLQLIVDTHIQADSGRTSDLDQVLVAEHVETLTVGGGFFDLSRFQNRAGVPASQVVPDNHLTPRRALWGGDGETTAQQTFSFEDRRTRASRLPVGRSGFLIRRSVATLDAGRVVFQLAKSPQAGTARGVTAEAGLGRAGDAGTIPTGRS